MDLYWLAGGVAGYLFLSACAGSYCSTAKGRSWLEGFTLGLILGPFGTVAAACLPEKAPALKVAEIAEPLRPRAQVGRAVAAAQPNPRRLLGEIREDRA